mgnify:CR=1 FL=1
MYAGVTFGQFMIKLRVKVEQVNDEARVKAVIQVRFKKTQCSMWLCVVLCI